MVSNSSSTDYDCTDTTWHSGINTHDDFYVLKLDTAGNVMFSKSFGGSNYEQVSNAIWDDRDSGLVIIGTTTSNDYMVMGNHGGEDFWVIKTDENGSLKWAKTFGGIYDDNGTSIAIKPDNGYVILGGTNGVIGHSDIWIFTLDNNGNIIADTVFGSINMDGAASVFPFNKGIIGTGWSVLDSFTDGNNFGGHNFGEQIFISYILGYPYPIEVPNYINENTITIFPNPSIKNVNVKIPCKGKLVITNILGQTLYTEYVNINNTTINVTEWVKGLYIVQLLCADGNTITAKLIIN